MTGFDSHRDIRCVIRDNISDQRLLIRCDIISMSSMISMAVSVVALSDYYHLPSELDIWMWIPRCKLMREVSSSNDSTQPIQFR